MNVFLTGATGFIGTHLARRLAADGHLVTCLVRDPARAQELRQLGARIVTGAIHNQAVVQQSMQGSQWVFHLANLYSMWEADPRVFHSVNVEGTRSVLQAAQANGVQKVMYVSSAAVFGKPADVPFTEHSTPGAELFSEYARSKAAGERLAWLFAADHGLPLVVLYPGIVLGAGDTRASGQYIRDLLYRRAPSTVFHQSTATYVAVQDVVEALVQAAVRQNTTGQRYLVGKYTLSGEQFAQAVQRASGVARPPFRLPDGLVQAAAHLLTALAAVTRRPPPWGLSIDAARTLRNGFVFDGAKAERELGLCYTPIQQAIEAEVAHHAAALRGSRTKK